MDEISPLGTKDYWDQIYERESKEFQQTGDIGEVWFGEEPLNKMVNWIQKNYPCFNSRILDIGCGNGNILLELDEYNNLFGIDYSEHSICLAKRIQETRSLNNISYSVCDILDPNQTKLLGEFDLICDKGTLDAIILGKSDAYLDYQRNISSLLKCNGKFIITSCNWTENELVGMLKDSFVLFSKIPYKVIRFGGKTGQTVTTLIFSKRDQ
jgi:2-polyprenyl-3-methyl-5-hydroxy-6-metoxy-1,4-benzoquinol methylase